MVTQKRRFGELSKKAWKGGKAMIPDKKKWVEYRCSWCGMTQTRSVNTGKPAPGNCPRRPKLKNGQSKPHVWTVNRRY